MPEWNHRVLVDSGGAVGVEYECAPVRAIAQISIVWEATQNWRHALA